MHRKTLLLSLLAPLAVAASTAAAASGPETTRFDIRETFTDTELCAFPVTFSFRRRGTDTVYGQDSGARYDEVIHATTTGTVTNEANGRALLQRGGASLFIDEERGTATFRGLPQQFLAPLGGVLARDAGTVTFDGEGAILELHGPHPLITDFEATAAEICAYLAASGG